MENMENQVASHEKKDDSLENNSEQIFMENSFPAQSNELDGAINEDWSELLEEEFDDVQNDNNYQTPEYDELGGYYIPATGTTPSYYVIDDRIWTSKEDYLRVLLTPKVEKDELGGYVTKDGYVVNGKLYDSKEEYLTHIYDTDAAYYDYQMSINQANENHEKEDDSLENNSEQIFMENSFPAQSNELDGAIKKDWSELLEEEFDDVQNDNNYQTPEYDELGGYYTPATDTTPSYYVIDDRIWTSKEDYLRILLTPKVEKDELGGYVTKDGYVVNGKLYDSKEEYLTHIYDTDAAYYDYQMSINQANENHEKEDDSLENNSEQIFMENSFPVQPNELDGYSTPATATTPSDYKTNDNDRTWTSKGNHTDFYMSVGEAALYDELHNERELQEIEKDELGGYSVPATTFKPGYYKINGQVWPSKESYIIFTSSFPDELGGRVTKYGYIVGGTIWDSREEYLKHFDMSDMVYNNLEPIEGKVVDVSPEGYIKAVDVVEPDEYGNDHSGKRI